MTKRIDGRPEQRSDGQGPHPPVEDLFVTREDFHFEMNKMRDRQERQTEMIINKTTRAEEKIIGSVKELIAEEREARKEEDKDLDSRMDKLEDKSRQENIVGSVIAGASAIVVGWITTRLGG
mgnify:FL=1